MAKRNCLSISGKIKLINEVEKGIKKKKDIADFYCIPSSSLSTIIKNKQKILDQATVSQGGQNQKKVRFCDYGDVDDAILQWVTTTRQKNLPISGPLLQEKAKQFAAALGHKDFTASNGWLEKFKKRYNIIGKVVCGEGGDVNQETSDNWIKNVLPNLIKEYDPKDIFNADETALFFKCLPSRTLAFKNEKCVGGKKSKERVTVMVGSNFTGSEKLKLLVIGKAKNPRCFKGLNSLEVSYENNTRAWMTSAIYEKWLIKLDKKFAYQKRKILLFVDNCPAHPKQIQDKLTSIKIFFFPPNMTSSLQPMDQGIIQNLKQHYRKRILGKTINCSEENVAMSISLLDAIRELNKSWVGDVKPRTISNCFKKAGFVINNYEELISSDDEDNMTLAAMSKRDLADSDLVLEQLWEKCIDAVTDVNLDDFLNVDDDVVTMDNPTKEDILHNIMKSHYDMIDSDEYQDEEGIEEMVKLPTFSETSSALQAVHTFVESRSDVPKIIFDSINLLEDFLEKEKDKAKTQTKIDQFFIPQ